MIDLLRVHADVRAALEPLGIEVGPETLGIWRDRERLGQAPLPADALRRLAELAQRLARQHANAQE